MGGELWIRRDPTFVGSHCSGKPEPIRLDEGEVNVVFEQTKYQGSFLYKSLEVYAYKGPSRWSEYFYPARFGSHNDAQSRMSVMPVQYVYGRDNVLQYNVEYTISNPTHEGGCMNAYKTDGRNPDPSIAHFNKGCDDQTVAQT